MTTFLLVLWIALLGADRVNLLAGLGPFILTPFLILTPLVLALEGTRLGLARGTIRIPPRTVPFLGLAAALLAIVSVSALLGGDPPLSIKRTALLIAHMSGTFLGGLVLLNQERPERILVRGAYLGLLLGLVFNVGQVYNWVTGNWDSGQEETELLFNLAPRTYGTILPRLSGTSIDQGQGGLLAVFFLFIVYRFAPRSRLRTAMLGLGGIFLVGTLARAAFLAALVAAFALWLQDRSIRFTRPQVVGAAAVGIALSLVVLTFPPELETALGYLEPLTDRFSTREGSSRVHLALIEHGWFVATSSLHNALLGIGYGNGLSVLQDFFPGNRYANFHSLYVTLLAESGVFALGVGLVLLFTPLVLGGPFAPLLAGFLAFSVFYQANAEPTFWLILALAWLTAGPGRAGAASGDESPAEAREAPEPVPA